MITRQQQRYEVEEGVNGSILIKDTYNSDLTSLTKHALGFLEQQSVNQNRSRTLIVSDIDGNEVVCEMFYANIQKIIAEGTVNNFIFIGNELAAHQNLFNTPNKRSFLTANEFLSSNAIDQLHNQAILLKIASQSDLEMILSHLQLLVHDTVLETNFDALFHNIDYFRTKLKPNTKLMCMVKASAYGSGSIEVSRAIQHHKCNYLGVAFVNEGVEIRQAGIELPIMVLNPMKPALHQLFTYRLEPEVCSFEMLHMIIDAAQKHHIVEYPIHLKLDSGMHRAGFCADELPKVLEILQNQKQLKLASVFSHLAGADDPELDTYTLLQIRQFDEMSNKVLEAFEYPILRHILNTAGIERFSQYQFDMVRLGIGLWGVNCQNEHLLRNVCSLKTKIIQIKSIKAGETVGYNRKGILSKDSEIALLPLGYADGINRKLSNGVGSVIYNGQRVPIVGNICMDLLMIDVTNLKAAVGDEVMLFDDSQPISEIAALLDTIPYEVLTGIAPRVRRVYYRQ